jgi:hypothetical protein
MICTRFERVTEHDTGTMTAWRLYWQPVDGGEPITVLALLSRDQLPRVRQLAGEAG